MSMLKIYTSTYPSGVDLLAPKSFKFNSSDLDSEKTTRTASGVMNRDRVRARVRKLELEWSALTRSQMATVINHFNSDTAFTASDGTSVPKGFIYLEYPTPYSTSNEKKVMYVGDRSTPLYNFTSGLWEGLSLNLIER